ELVDVAANHPPDDVLVERAAHVRSDCNDRGRLGAPGGQDAGDAAVARAGLAAAALSECAEGPRANRARPGAAATDAGPGQTQPGAVRALADLVADEAPQHVLRVVAERGVTAENRRNVRAIAAVEQRQNAGLLRGFLGELPGSMQVPVVL